MVLAAVAHKGYALKDASTELRGDREVVLTAVRGDPSQRKRFKALQFASAEMQGDPEVRRTAGCDDDAAAAGEAAEAEMEAGAF